uniref:Uncharacterized protein n=1 Tax=Arundo donax TaxID=35708 RepID=A0A0A8ZXV4_ARUDO
MCTYIFWWGCGCPYGFISFVSLQGEIEGDGLTLLFGS